MCERLSPNNLEKTFRGKVRPFVTSFQSKLYDIFRPKVKPQDLETDAGISKLVQTSIFGAVGGIGFVGIVAFGEAISSIHYKFPYITDYPVLVIGGFTILSTMACAYPLIFHRPISKKQ